MVGMRLPQVSLFCSWSQCCGCGSGIRCPFDPWTPGIRNSFFRIPDPKPIFLRAQWQIFGLKVSIILGIWLKFVSLLRLLKKIGFNFIIFHLWLRKR
jgi:hypothetical protein